jgi:hypothetical protein
MKYFLLINMKFIKILNWSQITTDNINYYPVFFFHPTVDILNYIYQNGYDVNIIIQNTNNAYDNIYLARFNIANLNQKQTIDMNSNLPLYSIILDTPFTIYPCQNGEFTIYNQNNIIENFEEIPLNDFVNSSNLDINTDSSNININSINSDLNTTLNNKDNNINQFKIIPVKTCLNKYKRILYILFFMFVFILCVFLIIHFK